ncbi:MAG: hypothetical protein KC635_09380, partial [Myxococcales bacterium]|nr:hypothetical protein [Myxococcales bacterium]
AALLLDMGAPASQIRRLLLASGARNGGAAQLSNQAGTGVVDVAKATGFVANYDEAALNALPRYYVNAVVVFQAAADGRVRPTAVVEVRKESGATLNYAKVAGHFGVAGQESAVAETDGQGRAVFQSAESYDPDEAFVAFTVDGVQDPASLLLIRPTGGVQVDTLSFKLIANLGVGLGGSNGVALDFSPSALASLPIPDAAAWPVQTSYDIRALGGAGLVSSAIVFGTTPQAFRSLGLFSDTLYLKTNGTGLVSSAIILDGAFFTAAAKSASKYGNDSLWLRNTAIGTGLVSSAIIWKGASYPFDHFFTGTNPVVLQTASGTGLVSSAILWNPGFLSTTIQQPATYAWSGAPLFGTGLVSSAIVLPYQKSVIDTLSYSSWTQLSTYYPTGAGLVSSALVASFDPFQTYVFSLRSVTSVFTSGLSESSHRVY